MRPMGTARPPSLLPGPIRQNGYVVRDLRSSIDAWLEIGVGPWLVLPHLTQAGTVFRGRPSEPTASFAFANSGDLQVELIEPEDEEPSAYREFLDGGHEGLHHLAWWAEDYGGVLGRLRQAGWTVVQEGDSGGLARFAYLDQGGTTSRVVEVMELTDATKWLAATVRSAADDWDGSEPVRPLL